MAYTDTTNIVLHMPIPGTQEPAAISLLNENCVQLDLHDHLAGRGVGVGRLRSGLAAAIPATGNAGAVYFSTDTGLFYLDTGVQWVQFHTDPGGGAPDVELIDPIVRDRILFAAKPTGPVDASLYRTGPGGLRVDSYLGIVSTPSPWSGYNALQVQASSIWSGGVAGLFLSTNTYYDGAARRQAAASGQAPVEVNIGINGTANAFAVNVCVPGAVNSVQNFVNKLVLSNTGTLTTNPDVGSPAFLAGNSEGSASLQAGGGINTLIAATGGASIKFLSSGTYVMPNADLGVVLGHPTFRWAGGYTSVAFTVGSSADLKEDISPLDPAACVEAVLGTDWVNYAYKAPPPPDAAASKGESKEDGEDGKAYARMLTETASSRQQKGYVLQHETLKVHDLFGLPDRKTRSDGADLAVVACALQDALTRIIALESANAPTP